MEFQIIWLKTDFLNTQRVLTIEWEMSNQQPHREMGKLQEVATFTTIAAMTKITDTIFSSIVVD